MDKLNGLSLQFKHYRKLKRYSSNEKNKYIKAWSLYLVEVEAEIVMHDKKPCLSYKSPNLSHEVRATGPIILIEKVDFGYKIVTLSEWDNVIDNMVYELHY